MLKLAALIDNPGEPPVPSRYRDPKALRQLGYNGVVIYETTALSGLASADMVQSAELRRWVQNHIDHVQRTIDQAHAAGLKVFIFYDVLVLARDLVERNVSGLCCKNRPGVLCPASDQAIQLSVDALQALLNRWSNIEGVALRFGDTDAPRLPHLIGNDVYLPHCPRCSQFGRADRIVSIIARFYDLVVQQCNKHLIVRAWNVRPNGLHDSAELARRVMEQLPGKPEDERLILSFKFTQTDFWRYQKWNPSSLVTQGRPVIYELQCQREFEGKGGMPNWQVPLWRDGYPETSVADEPAGLAQISGQVNLAGLWAWVRGGGWGGPYIKDESWIDANVFAVPLLADQPQMKVEELGRQWIAQRLRIDDQQIADELLAILHHSPQIVRQMFYIGPFAQQKKEPWHPNADWIQDDLIDAEAAWRMIQRVPEARLDEVMNEKRAAVEQHARDRAALQQLVSDRSHGELERLVNTLIYSESLYEMMCDLLAGLVAYRRFMKSRQPGAADTVRQKLFSAQSHWNHHTQRHGSLPGSPTAFREASFWELTQRMLAEVM